MKTVNCLTVRQPWAQLLCLGTKNIENRSWYTNYRGWLYIHASRSMGRLSARAALIEAQLYDQASLPNNVRQGVRNLLKQYTWLFTGAIIGKVKLEKIVEGARGFWAVEDQYHWIVSHAVCFKKPIAMRGNLGIWRAEVPDNY